MIDRQRNAAVTQAMMLAVEHHEAGRLAEAERIYRQVLEVEPDNANALNLLALMARQAGNNELAMELVHKAVRAQPKNPYFLNNLAEVCLTLGRLAEAERACRKALSLKPDYAEAHCNQGAVLSSLGRLEDAERSYKRAIALRPDYVEAHNNLAVALRDMERLQEAELYCKEALRLGPGLAEAHNNLGTVYRKLDRKEEAEAAYRRALELGPFLHDAHYNLGNLLNQLGRLYEAVQSYLQALAIRPDHAETHHNLGNTLSSLGQFEQAEGHYRRALFIRPKYAEVHNRLGMVLKESGRIVDAERAFRDALAIKPDFAPAHANLGDVYKELGRLGDVERSYRKSLEIEPHDAVAHSGLLLTLNYVPGLSAQEIYAEHVAFARRFCPVAAIEPHGNVADAGRRLRIGYVSGDWREHPVGQFIEPVLARHDHAGFEIFCYSNHPRADARTARLKARADVWREVFALDDAALEKTIREDGIDILVDLSGHTGFNRLPVFGRKPAPVQASWLGYLNTTGLAAIDWRITDAHASPPGLFEAYHSEHLARLPDSQWCYQAPPGCPEVAPPPSQGAGHVTFGAFSNLAKIGPPVIELWRRLLARVPGARLLVVGNGLGAIAEEMLERFTSYGVAPERIELSNSVSFPEYLALHARVDIMLDTFPYAGGTTSCHALWMGVPLVTLAGETAASRGGASLLNAIGLPELVAQTPGQYLEIAAGLATDQTRLAGLRAGMRERMAASALMDVPGFTRNLENAYRSMWRQWCGSAEASN